MVRKKSVLAKVKIRKKAYQRQVARLGAARSWHILMLVIKAKKKFLGFRIRKSISNISCSNICTAKFDVENNSNYNSFVCKDTGIIFSNMNDVKVHFENLNIIRNTIKNIISKVCRLDNERKRQSQMRRKKCLSNDSIGSKTSVLKHIRQRTWFKRKYLENALFRIKTNERVTKNFRLKYMHNIGFCEKEKARLGTYVLSKYQKDIEFRRKTIDCSKTYILNKYHTNTTFRTKYKELMKKSFQ